LVLWGVSRSGTFRDEVVEWGFGFRVQSADGYPPHFKILCAFLGTLSHVSFFTGGIAYHVRLMILVAIGLNLKIILPFVMNF